MLSNHTATYSKVKSQITKLKRTITSKKHGYYISKWSQSSQPRKLFNLNHRRGCNQKALIISNFQYINVEKEP